MNMQAVFHPDKSENEDIQEISANACSYKDPSINKPKGPHYLNIRLDQFSVVLHSLKAKEIWRLSAAIEEAALTISPPDAWLENPIPGNLQLAETDTGSQIQVAETERETTLFGDIADSLSDAEKSRQVRLVNAAEQLLEFAKRTLLPPISIAIQTVDAFLDWSDSEALRLIRIVEPDVPAERDDARVYLGRQFSERTKAAGDATRHEDDPKPRKLDVS